MAEHDETVSFLLKKANLKEDKTKADSLGIEPSKDAPTRPDSSAMVPNRPDEPTKPDKPLEPTEKFEQAEPDRGYQEKDITEVEEFMRKQKEAIK